MATKEYYRRGPDHRQGRSLGFAELRRQFDFRSIRIGHWVRPEEQAQAAVHFYDALMDLMCLLQGNETLITLRGQLSLSYGTGGRRGVAAHYSPAERNLALAKNAGPGSLAHEWFHALDHYLVQQLFVKPPKGFFASSAWLQDHPTRPHPINACLEACFRSIFLSPDGQEPSALFQASLAQDRSQGSVYYSLPEEMAARAFEAYIQDAWITNHYLVKGSLQSPEAKRGLYPQGEQREAIKVAFEAYFSRLGPALRAQQEARSHKSGLL
ncbi:CLCA_X family protein [Marinospirillum perlucidum]|uniref:CLCA_X family protein n=1 Tax=Marinospirillum perlucidum TaxID=1982602 RepID=UPI000DF399E7|nr:CLCA_X family protein [Marinospirillum perlucidum]